MLVDQVALQSQPGPRLSDLSYLRKWLEDPKGGASQLRGPGEVTWNKTEEGGREPADLICLDPSSWNEKAPTQWILDLLWPLLRLLPKALMPVSVIPTFNPAETMSNNGPFDRFESTDLSQGRTTLLSMAPPRRG